MGYLDYDKASRTYMPTMRVATLGHWVQDALFGDNRILPFMQHLSAVTGEMVCLGTQSDLLAQYIYVIPSSRPLDLRLRSGTVRPLAGSGLGYLLLSARSDDEIETLLRRINARKRDPSRRIALAGLMQQVNDVRRQGYVFSRNIMPGFGLIAMLLPIALPSGSDDCRRRLPRLFVLMRTGPDVNACPSNSSKPLSAK